MDFLKHASEYYGVEQSARGQSQPRMIPCFSRSQNTRASSPGSHCLSFMYSLGTVQALTTFIFTPQADHAGRQSPVARLLDRHRGSVLDPPCPGPSTQSQSPRPLAALACLREQ